MTEQQPDAPIVDPAEKVRKQLEWEKQEIERVAAKHNVKKVLMLKVPIDDTFTQFAYGFIKYPSRTDVSIAMTMQNTDPLKGKEIVLRNSWLEGDMQLIDDEELFLSTATTLDDVLSIRQAIVKKNW